MVVKLNTDLTENLAELHERLGWVPLNRICSNPPPGTATEEDLLYYLESPNKRLFELVDNTLVEKAVGAKESLLASFISSKIWAYLQIHDLGVCLGADGGIRMLRGNVRFPDVSYFSWESLPDEEIEDRAIWNTFPSLAIEVLSDLNTESEIERKINELFAGGTRLVWVIDPSEFSTAIYSSPKKIKKLSASDSLDGGKILPGFRLSLAELFSSTKRKKKKPNT